MVHLKRRSLYRYSIFNVSPHRVKNLLASHGNPEGTATGNPHRASARKPAPREEHSRIAWCEQVRHGWIRSGGASSALPSLACLWPSEARVCSPRPGRVAVYLQVYPGRQRRRKTTQKRKFTCGKAPALGRHGRLSSLVCLRHD